MLNDKLHKQPAHSEYCHMFYVISFLAYLEHLNECSLICLWADHLSIKARLEYVWILPVNKKADIWPARRVYFMLLVWQVFYLY